MIERSSLSSQDILKGPYARILTPTEDGTYLAEILEFPGCFAEGETAEEAILNLENAAVSWIEAATELGQEIPEPSATYGYSGKVNLRLPKSIHKQAVRFAERDQISLNQFFLSAIAARVGAEDLFDRLAKRVSLHQHVFLINQTSATSIQWSIGSLNVAPISQAPPQAWYQPAIDARFELEEITSNV